MERADEVKRILKDLFESQRFAVLSTHREGQPYASLMAFAVTEDLREILFATSRMTRKYSNLGADPRAAMLIDSRSNRESDIRLAVAVTATGAVREIEEDELDSYLALYLNKHPHLQDFAKSPSCALMVLRVESYSVVRRFQHVMELHVAS